MEGHCYTCNRLAEWAIPSKGRLPYGGIANASRTAPAIAQAEADTGGYRCAVCGERPYKKATTPGRQRWPWEGDSEIPFEDSELCTLKAEDIAIAETIKAHPEMLFREMVVSLGVPRSRVSAVAESIGLARRKRKDQVR